MKDLKEAIEILLKYIPEGEYAGTEAEHDMIYLSGPAPEDISPEDVDRLDALNAYYDESFDSWVMYT
jgi:hypothetical protein